MIVVTGSPRTGTSLMMQTLGILGIPVSGMPFHPDFSNYKLNKNGYLELPIDETINGINTNKHEGRAVKLFGLQLSRTDPRFVKKIIVCNRNKPETIESIKRLLDSERWQLEKRGLKCTPDDAENTYQWNYDFIARYILEHNIPFLSVSYEDMINDKYDTVFMVAKFVGVDKCHHIEEAIKNISNFR